MAIGEQERPKLIEFIDWHELYARDDGDDAIIPCLAYRGRWTALAAPGKEGKSTVIIGLVHNAAKTGNRVIYLDAEMGRADMLDRVEEWMHLKPEDLTNIHYTDLPPKLDTIEGSAMLGEAVERLQPDLVVMDGLNGVVLGDENEDQTWRTLYEYAIAPLKALNVAVLTVDNTGHTDKKRPRGHSVKIDKPDAIVALERTDNGVKLTCSLRRTSAYPLEQFYTVSHASEEGPAMEVVAVAGDMPLGTAGIVSLLDRLGAPEDIGVKAARRLVREHGGQGRNQIIDAARKIRLARVPDLGQLIDKSPGPWGAPHQGVSLGTPCGGRPGHLPPQDCPRAPSLADAGLE